MDANYVYYPSDFNNLPTTIPELTFIATCAPMKYIYSKDFPLLVSYLCDPKCILNNINCSGIYIPGQNVSNEYLTLQNRISKTPTMTFRQVLLQLSSNPNATKAKQYEQIMKNWAFKTLYTDPEKKVSISDINVLELYSCICVVANSFIQIKSYLSSYKDTIIQWIKSLLDLIESFECPYQNNIMLTGYMAKIMCSIILEKPLIRYSHELNEFAFKNTTKDGFLLSESRENATIVYHNRYLIMFLQAQCYLFQAGYQIANTINRDLIIKVINNMEKYAGTTNIMRPSFFHTHSGWKDYMTPVTQGDINTLRQMVNFLYNTNDLKGLVDTKWFWSSMTFGDLSVILKSINQVSPSLNYMPLAADGQINTQRIFYLKDLSAKPIDKVELVYHPDNVEVSNISKDSLTISYKNITFPTSYLNLWINGTTSIYIPYHVYNSFIIKHPVTGLAWKYDEGTGKIKLSRGKELNINILNTENIYNNNNGRVSMFTDFGYIYHTNYFLKMCNILLPHDCDFSWYFLKTGEIYNDYGNGYYVGYDPATDAIKIVTSKSPLKVYWKFSENIDSSILH